MHTQTGASMLRAFNPAYGLVDRNVYCFRWNGLITTLFVAQLPAAFYDHTVLLDGLFTV